MIGNFSFNEHLNYFSGMYDHLRSIDYNLDNTTIINIIKCKVILEQERENIMHNLNIKNIHDTPMVKDFKTWCDLIDLPSEEEDEESEEEESEEEESNESDEDDEDEDEESEDEDSEEENEYGEAAPFGYKENSDGDIPDDY